jgi:hypothetical protein
LRERESEYQPPSERELNEEFEKFKKFEEECIKKFGEELEGLAGLEELNGLEGMRALGKLERLRPGILDRALGVIDRTYEIISETQKPAAHWKKAGDILLALRVIEWAKDVRERLQNLDAGLVLRIMNLAAFPHMRAMDRMYSGFPIFSAGLKNLFGGIKGRASRPPKLTDEQRAVIRQEMTAAKYGTKKAIKLALADKHRISVREIERIAAEK